MIDQFTPNIIKNVAKRIDYLRVQQNYSIRELSKKAGIAPSALFNIIQGNKIPNIYTLDCICSALHSRFSIIQTKMDLMSILIRSYAFIFAH